MFSLDNSLVDHQILKLCFIFILNAVLFLFSMLFATMVLNGMKQLPGLVFALTTAAAEAEGLRLPCAQGRREAAESCWAGLSRVAAVPRLLGSLARGLILLQLQLLEPALVFGCCTGT